MAMAELSWFMVKLILNTQTYRQLWSD
jgi:hypothetical protein